MVHTVFRCSAAASAGGTLAGLYGVFGSGSAYHVTVAVIVAVGSFLVCARMVPLMFRLVDVHELGERVLGYVALRRLLMVVVACYAPLLVALVWGVLAKPDDFVRLTLLAAGLLSSAWVMKLVRMLSTDVHLDTHKMVREMRAGGMSVRDYELHATLNMFEEQLVVGVETEQAP